VRKTVAPRLVSLLSLCWVTIQPKIVVDDFGLTFSGRGVKKS
jgi:hypothetical protein